MIETDFYEKYLCYYNQARQDVVKCLLVMWFYAPPDLPIINPLIPLGSRGDYNVYFSFHSKRDFLHPFLYLSFF